MIRYGRTKARTSGEVPSSFFGGGMVLRSYLLFLFGPSGRHEYSEYYEVGR
jgi:hypothetical protein